MASTKKSGKKRGQTIVFVDESGLSERPPRVRTDAGAAIQLLLEAALRDRGGHLLAVLLPLASRQHQRVEIVEFLAALTRQIPGPLLIIWDGLHAHKSKVVRHYIEREDVDIQLAFLPAYAPELNPVEHLWGYLKTHEVGNLCASTVTQASDFARRRLRSKQRRPTLVTAF